MKKNNKTNGQLLAEINLLKTKIAKLEKPDTERLSAEQTGKQVEEALRESELKFRSVFENSPDIVALTDLKGTLLDVNKVAPGYKKEDVIGSGFTDYLTSVQKKLFTDTIQKAVETGKPQGYEVDITNPEGRTLSWHNRICPIRSGGKVTQAVINCTDITERKQAEEKLKKSEERFKQVVEATGDWIWEVDKEGLYTFVSKKSKNVLGYMPDEIIGKKHFYDFFKPEIKNDFKNAAFEVFSKKESFNSFENPNIHRDGRIIILETSGTPLIDSEGNLLGYRGADRDITERKKAEELLHQYEHIVSSSTDMLALLDKEFNYLAVNDAYLEAFNLIPEEVIGNTAANVFGEEHFETVIKPNAQRCLLGEQVNYQGWSEFPAYEPRYMDINYYPHYSEDNKIIGFVVSARNITDRKQVEEKLRESEERYDLAMNATKDGIFDLNLLTNEAYYSPGWKGLLGYKDDELPNDLSIWENLTEPEAVKRSWKMQNEVINKERDCFEMEFKMKHKDGHWVDILSRAGAIFDEFGKAVRIIGTHVDITERKQAEDKLSDSMAQIRNLAAHLHTVREEERAEIARNIHDDMGQILTTLKINLSLIEAEIQSDNKPIKQLHLLEELQDMQYMIDNAIFNIKKLVKELRPEVLDNLSLLEVLKWQADEFENRNQIKCLYTSNVTNIDLNNEKSTAIFRILQEVLTNVLRHSKATTVTISFNKKNGKLILKINDNGIGFSEKKVFDSNSFGLLGMRERAMVFGGELEIITQKGKGTTVTLSIPIG